MTLKSYLWGIRFGTVLSFIAWVMVILYINPEKSGFAGHLLFYASTFLFFAGVLILFFTWMKRRIGDDDEVAFIYLGTSFRQGILIALLLIGLLILQQHRMLLWWNGLLMVAGIFLMELYFLTRR